MNRPLTAEQMINETLALMEKHGLPKLFAEASPEDQIEMLRLLSNMFGGRFPPEGVTDEAINLLRAWTAGCGDEHFSTKEQCRELLQRSGEYFAKLPEGMAHRDSKRLDWLQGTVRVAMGVGCVDDDYLLNEALVAAGGNLREAIDNVMKAQSLEDRS